MTLCGKRWGNARAERVDGRAMRENPGKAMIPRCRQKVDCPTGHRDRLTIEADTMETWRCRQRKERVRPGLPDTCH